MQNDKKTGIKYAGFEDGKIYFSSLQYLVERIKNNKNMELKIPIAPYKIDLPFCIAGLVCLDDWIKFLFLNNNAHRRLIESIEFAELAKQTMRSAIKKPKIVNGKYEVYLRDNKFWPLIWWKLSEIYAPLQYNLVKRVLHPTKNNTIFEIGCATGNLTVRCARDARSVMGVDNSKYLIERAEKRKEKLGLKNCRFVYDEYPCYLRQKFDYTIAFNTSFVKEKFYDHIFPSREVLIVNFVSNDSKEAEEVLKNQGLSNFEKNYRIETTKETWKELGERLYIAVNHLEMK